MLRNDIIRSAKRNIHAFLAFFGFELYKNNSKLKLRRRFYIGSEYLSDISSIVGGSKNIYICVDGGAHDGETAQLFANAFPQSMIYSFEPEKKNFLALLETVSSCKRIIPINMAIGADTDVGTFVVNMGSQTGSLLTADQSCGKYVFDPMIMQPASTEEVSIVALQDWVKTKEIHSIDLLKLDLQGYELKALEGARSLLSSQRILFIYLEVNFVPAYEGQAKLTELYDYLTNFGYRLVGLYPSEFSAQYFHYRCGGDLLFVLEDLQGYKKNHSSSQNIVGGN